MPDITTVNGKPCVTLTDHKSRKHLYEFEVRTFEDRTEYIFSKLGDLEDPQYRVIHRAGSWRCSCPAYLYSRALIRVCKHVTCCKSLAAFLDAANQAT